MENDIISLIHSGNEYETKYIFYEYRAEFLNYGRKNFALDQEKLSDIYQDSFTAVVQNIKNDRLTQLSCSFKTYLFRVARNQALNLLNKTTHYTYIPIEPESEEEELLYTEADTWNEKQNIVYHIVSALEPPCSQILNLFYWNKKSMNEIARIMGYKTEQVAKNRKSICLKHVKERVMEEFRKEDLL